MPTKALLNRPLPANVHVVTTCLECNNGFAPDEEYFAAFLGAVLAGSTDPEAQHFNSARNALAGNARLRREIEGARTESPDEDGPPRLVWTPDMDRIRRIVVKNARGHVFHELGQLIFGEPEHVAIMPKVAVDDEQLAEFMTVDMGSAWPEVGSRLLQGWSREPISRMDGSLSSPVPTCSL